MIKNNVFKKLKIWNCLRCNHVWVSNKRLKISKPKFCPRCKSPYWDRKRRNSVNEKLLLSITRKLV